MASSFARLEIKTSLADSRGAGSSKSALATHYSFWHFHACFGARTVPLAGLYIGHPDCLYPVDCEPPELNGFVTLANVDGDDTFLAYNPEEHPTEGTERKIYFCNYDEYAVTTASFEDCIRSITALWLKNPGKDALGEFCEQLEFLQYSKK